MNLVLDFGNTRIKAGVFKGTQLAERHVFDTVEQLGNSGLPDRVGRCIICSVTGGHEKLFAGLSKKIPVILFEASTPAPLSNRYRSKSTLGSDRLAVSVGANTLYPSQNVLTIDAGTCIKYNFVNAGNEYLGGAISPGIGMRLKAMHHFTHKLPLTEPDSLFAGLVGIDTRESLLAGAQLGATCEADAMIDRYRAAYPDLVVLLTGGDALNLSRQLKNRFFADQNLLLSGLNTILNFNLEK